MKLAASVAARYLLGRTRWVRRRRGWRAAGHYVLAFNTGALADAVVRCRRQGLNWELRPADVAQRTLYCLGSYEGPLRRLLVEAVRPGDVVLDVGAHVGLLSCPIASEVAAAGSGRVIAFEPAPDTAAHLRRNLELNGLEHVTTVVQAGLSDESGHAVLRGDPAYGPEGSSLRSLFGTGGGDADVELLRFDDWWRDAGQPRLDIVKMDVEGAEGQALRGMVEAIRACEPRLLVIEMKGHLAKRAGGSPSAVEGLLDTLGYDRQPPISRLLGHRDPMPWLDENVVFTRKGSPMTLNEAAEAPGHEPSPSPRAGGRPLVDRRRLTRLVLRKGGQKLLARRRRPRWWLVYGPARSGTTFMILAINENAKLLVGDWVLGPALQQPPEVPHNRFDRERARRDTSRNILSNAHIGGGGRLDLAYKQAWLELDEYEALVAMWGPPERKIFCFREPSGYMASAVKKFPDLPRDLIQRRYVESLDLFWTIGGDAFEYTPERTLADYVSFLAPLVVNETELLPYSSGSGDELVEPRMREAYRSFVDRLSGVHRVGGAHDGTSG